MNERATLDSGNRGVISRLEKALAAAKRFRCAVVKENSRGEYRPAARWAGSREATEAADRGVRLRHAERELRATGPDADRRRRLRLAELTLDPDTRRRLRLAAAERGWQ